MTKPGVLGVERFAVLVAAVEPLNGDGAVNVGADVTSVASVATQSAMKTCAETTCETIVQESKTLEQRARAVLNGYQTILDDNRMTNEVTWTRT